jgi:hypothetical protein
VISIGLPEQPSSSEQMVRAEPVAEGEPSETVQ